MGREGDADRSDSSRRLHLRFNLNDEGQHALWLALAGVPPGKRMATLLSLVMAREREAFEARLIRQVRDAIGEELRMGAVSSSSPGLPTSDAPTISETLPPGEEDGNIPLGVLAYLQEL